MPIRTLYFLALLFAVLSFGPAMGHFLELPNKIALPQEAYFVVQGIYRGWALLGIVVIGMLASSLALAIALRRRPGPFRWAVAAFVAAVASHAVFWFWTFPANRATENWARVPADWERLRQQWEFGHAAGAVLNFVAVIALIISLLAALRTAERQAALLEPSR